MQVRHRNHPPNSTVKKHEKPPKNALSRGFCAVTPIPHLVSWHRDGLSPILAMRGLADPRKRATSHPAAARPPQCECLVRGAERWLKYGLTAKIGTPGAMRRILTAKMSENGSKTCEARLNGFCWHRRPKLIPGNMRKVNWPSLESLRFRCVRAGHE